MEIDPHAETTRALQLLKRLIRESGRSQRAIEEEVGFSRGYLSQLLNEHIELKFWHVLAMLPVLGIEPRQFFGRLYPDPEHDVLERFRQRSVWRSDTVAADLEVLYDAGLESIRDLRERIESCELVLDRLGLFDEEER